jgi:hypothetical protein
MSIMAGRLQKYEKASLNVFSQGESAKNTPSF